ncbi:unnamed protein product [Acanthosepion pharaonis]|uniref:Uncharacterized protein n=1 Tax=Acanthosepion pharaonis TaxID=158019 RepID=A0A812C414_ACAPH|nr:unnamed protein product [Sepia pharaonis]
MIKFGLKGKKNPGREHYFLRTPTSPFSNLIDSEGYPFEIFCYFLSFSFRRLGTWLTIKQKFVPSLFRLGITAFSLEMVCSFFFFFLSFPSRALFKGLVTVETAFFLLDRAAFRMRRQTGPSIPPGDQFFSQFREHIFSAHMPRHSPDVLPVHRPRTRLNFRFTIRFLFLLVTWSIFKILTFSHYGWNEVIDPLSHLQGQRKFSLKCFNSSQPEYIRVNHPVNTLTKREGKGTLWSILVATKSTYLFGFTIFTFSASTGLFILECF